MRLFALYLQDLAVVVVEGGDGRRGAILREQQFSHSNRILTFGKTCSPVSGKNFSL
jgi:hypothetical protein